MPYGFDQRWRPNRTHTYTNAALRFEFEHPARLVVNTMSPASETGARLRLCVQNPANGEDHLFIWVGDSSIPPSCGRGAMARLVITAAPRMANALQDWYAKMSSVLQVRQRGCHVVWIGGAPTLHWAARLSTDGDGPLHIDHWECFAAGGVRFTAVSITRPGHARERRELRRVVLSATFDHPWPDPHGSVWVVRPRSTGPITSTTAVL